MALQTTHNWFGGGPPQPSKRKVREQFMFGSEPIEAWRLWGVSTGADQIGSFGQFIRALANAQAASPENPYAALLETRLTAVANGEATAWDTTPRESLCSHGGHTAPKLECECGYWALRDDKDLAKLYLATYTSAQVFGKVKMWGRYCEFDKGFRAQYAHPSELWVLNGDERVAAKLRDVYKVPVSTDTPVAVKKRQSVLRKRVGKRSGYNQAQQGLSQQMLASWSYQNIVMSGAPLAKSVSPIQWYGEDLEPEWPEEIAKPSEFWAEIQKQAAA